MEIVDQLSNRTHNVSLLGGYFCLNGTTEIKQETFNNDTLLRVEKTFS